MKIMITIEIDNQIYQFQAIKEFRLFSIPVKSPKLANNIVYRIGILESVAEVGLEVISDKIIAKHGLFLEQMSNGKKWKIEYNIFKGK